MQYYFCLRLGIYSQIYRGNAPKLSEFVDESQHCPHASAAYVSVKPWTYLCFLAWKVAWMKLICHANKHYPGSCMISFVHLLMHACLEVPVYSWQMFAQHHTICMPMIRRCKVFSHSFKYTFTPHQYVHFTVVHISDSKIVVFWVIFF